jgi:hypothetical protein
MNTTTATNLLTNSTLNSNSTTSSRVEIEFQTSLILLRHGLAEVEVFCKEHPSIPEFELLRTNLQGLETLMLRVQEWHQQHVARFQQASNNNNNDDIFDSQQRRLFLAEISILLVTPYFHRLLTNSDRDNSNNNNKLNDILTPEREKACHLHFQHIDPVYVTRYSGICLAGLLRSIERNHSTLLSYISPSKLISCLVPGNNNKLKLTHRQRGDAKILAGRFFGAQVCLELILNLTATEDDDLILERAVGSQSRLWVDGIQETALLYNRSLAEQHVHAFTGWVLMANSVVNAGFFSKYSIVKYTKMAIAGCYYILPCNWEEAEHRGQVCYTGTRSEIAGKLHFARFVWNLPESLLVKTFYRLGLPRIKIDHEFYIPPLPPAEWTTCE